MAIVGTGSGITAGIEGPAVAPATTEEVSFWSKVDEFKAKADEAGRVWQSLREKRQAAQSNPKLESEYDQVMGEAESITGKVSDVEKAISAVRSGVSDTIMGWFGLEGYDALKSDARAHLGELGAIQFAIMAVVAGIAWLGTWISKAYIVDRKLTAVENLNAQGVPIDEAGKIISDRPDPGPLDIFAGKLGTGLAVAGLAAVVLYFFFEKKRGF